MPRLGCSSAAAARMVRPGSLIACAEEALLRESRRPNQTQGAGPAASISRPFQWSAAGPCWPIMAASLYWGRASYDQIAWPWQAGFGRFASISMVRTGPFLAHYGRFFLLAERVLRSS